MKKILFFLVIFGFAASSFAQNISNRFLFIEGTSEREDHLKFFLENFTIEARTRGYTVTSKKQDAAYTFKFSESLNVIRYNSVEIPVPQGDNKYILKITLLNNKTNEESLSFDFYFSELSEMYEYTQFLFHRATVYIPPATVDELVDRSWQNKVMYLRASFDYPIIFHALQPAGLIGGQAVYGEDENGKPSDFQRLDNKIQPQPGVTVGIEFQIFNFLCLEGIFKANFGDTNEYSFMNMATGGHLKFPIKTRYLILQPYAAYNYHLNISPLFKEFPLHAYGGGIQFAARGGKSGAFFADVNYMHYIDEAVMYNKYGTLTPNPPEIHYKRFVIGIGVGYKIGIFNRR